MIFVRPTRDMKYIMGTSKNCRERPESKADGAQKPESRQVGTNAAIGSRNKSLEVPIISRSDETIYYRHSVSMLFTVAGISLQ